MSRGFRFYLSFTNLRHARHNSSLAPGDEVHVRGWGAGVKVTPRPRAADEFDVYMTSGSHDERPAVHIGTVAGTPDGPVWKPELNKPGLAPAHIAKTGYRDHPYTVVSAIPENAHQNKARSDEYVCVILAGPWPSGEPRFAVVHANRVPGGHSWFTDDPLYGHEMSQTAAVTQMIQLTGHERPSCTRKHENEENIA